MEEGSQNLLSKMLKQKKIKTTNNLKEVIKSKYIIICIGTPIDGKLRPKTKEFLNFFKHLKKYLKKDHQIIIRSSVFPGICEKIYKLIKNKNKNLIYCP